jgi:hypothetical protein
MKLPVVHSLVLLVEKNTKRKIKKKSVKSEKRKRKGT